MQRQDATKMKKIVLFIGIALMTISPACKKEKTCQCTATQGQDMIDMGYYTGKESCSTPEKETQGYEGWVIKCVEVEIKEKENTQNK